MKKIFLSNLMLKFIALVLAIITWFYISGEMRRQALSTNSYSSEKK